MPRYVFVLRHSSFAALQDDAADMELPDDAAAREFAAKVLDDGGLAGRPPGMAPTVRSDRADQSSLRWSASRRDRFCVRNQMPVASCRLVQGRRSNYAVVRWHSLRTRVRRKLLSATLLKTPRLPGPGRAAETRSIHRGCACAEGWRNLALHSGCARTRSERFGWLVASPMSKRLTHCGLMPQSFLKERRALNRQLAPPASTPRDDAAPKADSRNREDESK